MELVVFLQFYAMLILLALLFIVFKFPQNHQQVEGSGLMYIVVRRRGGGEGGRAVAIKSYEKMLA